MTQFAWHKQGIPDSAVYFKTIPWDISHMFMQSEVIEWGIRSTGAASRSRLQCGRLLVELSQSADEICLASKQLSVEELREGIDSDAPVAWTNWTVCTGSHEVKILPGFPDLPVLAKQDSVFEVPPGGEARVFLRIPVTVMVQENGPGGEVLAEFSTETLPKVKFGEADRTESCFLLRDSASRAFVTDSDGADIQAPILIQNDSREVLVVKQICLRVARLSIFRSGNALWANETVVKYQGGISPSRISVKTGPPPEAAKARLIAGPREPGPATFVGRTFRSLTQWTRGTARCF